MPEVPPGDEGGQPSEPAVGRSEETQEQRGAAPGHPTHEAGPAWGPWGQGVPGWPPPWPQQAWGPAPGATPPWGTPPTQEGPGRPPGPPPWGPWAYPPYAWGPAPGWHAAPPAPRWPLRPVAVTVAVLAFLAFIGLGIGIGYSVWGAGTTASSAVGPAVPTRPFGGATAKGAFLGVAISPSGFVSGSATTPGAHVVSVVAGSPAAKAGIVAGDTIVSFGSRTISSGITLQFAVQHDAPGQHVKVGWTTKSGKHESATVILATRANRSIG